MKMQSCSKKLLEKSGIEVTPHRQQVLQVIEESEQALTPQVILEKIREIQPIDKVTLYRILDIFVSRKIIRRLTTASGPQRYEILCESHFPRHPHFVCQECGEMKCLNNIRITQFKERLLKEHPLPNFDIDLKLEGICSKCKI